MNELPILIGGTVSYSVWKLIPLPKNHLKHLPSLSLSIVLFTAFCIDGRIAVMQVGLLMVLLSAFALVRLIRG